MSRDYKNSGARPKRKPAKKIGTAPAILPFLSGLTVGLFVAFVIFLRGYSLDNPPFKKENNTEVETAEKTASKPLNPKFKFYTILEEREVKVPEWHLEEDEPTNNKDKLTENNPYLLQVGSFQKYTEADRSKAKLALLGITADIQRVVINGQDVWFRVRVGPISESEKLKEVRRKLEKNGMNVLLLRIRS